MESKGQTSKHGALHALTAAALALPGLIQSAPAVAQTPDNAVVTQFGHYEEGNRELYGVSSKFKPLETDSLQASTWFVTDRLTTTVNFRQDTWSGATPISTAPQEWRENRSRAVDGVSGATPYIAPGGLLFLDKKTLQPLATDGFGNLTGGTNTQLVHTISGASRETRMALDFNLRQQWDNSAMNFGAGVSSEPDYLSRFVAGGGQWDFNQKLTSVNIGMSYTASSNKAILDHDAAPYIYNSCGNASCNFVSSVSRIETESNGNHILYGDRHDAAATVGLTQILNQNAQVQTNLAYTRSQGYLSNPYKVVEVAFIDPAQQFLSPSPDALFVTVNSILENRPDLRNQWLWNIRYAQYIESADAGLHLNYSYFSDDWGIHAHTLEFQWAQPVGDGWTLTPMLRYYTQSAAYFYTPYLVTAQGQHTTTVDPSTGKPVTAPFDMSKLPTYYSSDYRLSGYGALGGGLTITKQFSKGVTFYLGGEYYKHAGGLKAGGGGEGSYSDFNSWLVNASLQFAMDAPGSPPMGDMSAEEHARMGHAGHEGHSGALAPAGVMFAHTMEKAGEFMAGLRYVNSRQAGSILNGSTSVDNAQVKTMGCEGSPCLMAPTTMSMDMYMLELMYAPADWVTLMLMPQFMDMTMGAQTGLLTQAEEGALPPASVALYMHHTLHDHTSGGVGDTGVYATFKLLESPGNELLATLGFTIPTGSVNVKLRDIHQIDAGFNHYHMQLGSGTWDFNPSITYTGIANKLFWGAQVSGVARLQDSNSSGYALGDIVQGTVWGGYQFSGALSATLRGIYTQEGAIKGGFNGTFHPVGPVDYTSNYGGRYWDLGAGMNYNLSGTWAGNQIGAEWVQPLKDDVNGYQLERHGSFYFTWQYMF